MYSIKCAVVKNNVSWRIIQGSSYTQNSALQCLSISAATFAEHRRAVPHLPPSSSNSVQKVLVVLVELPLIKCTFVYLFKGDSVCDAEISRIA